MTITNLTFPSKPLRAAAGVLALALALGACGSDGDSGGSDGSEGSGGSSGSAALIEAERSALADTVKVLSGEETLDYTIELPEGHEISEFSSDINRKWEDPNAGITDAGINASILWTPVAYDSAALIEGHQDSGGGDELLDQGDEDGLSYVTYSNPGESGEIYSVLTDTSRTLDDGTTLRCSAAVNVEAGATWDDDEIAKNAEATLEICTSANAAG